MCVCVFTITAARSEYTIWSMNTLLDWKKKKKQETEIYAAVGVEKKHVEKRRFYIFLQNESSSVRVPRFYGDHII